MPNGVTIERLTGLADRQACMADLDPIFFEASATRTFPDGAARQAFRQRWLGRYLESWPHLAHIARGSDGIVLGYIVGAHADPAADPRFADIGYWPQIAGLTCRYPAHLHINLAPQARGQGVGSRLIEAFCADAVSAGCPGVHLVTGSQSRNRSFYARNGFCEVATLVWAGTQLVMLARRLDIRQEGGCGQES